MTVQTDEDRQESELGESDTSRFRWSSMDQITPLHGDGTPYNEQELAELKAYHRDRTLARKQAALAASTDTEYNPPTDDEIAAAFSD